jgi:hypothetical protein
MMGNGGERARKAAVTRAENKEKERSESERLTKETAGQYFIVFLQQLINHWRSAKHKTLKNRGTSRLLVKSRIVRLAMSVWKKGRRPKRGQGETPFYCRKTKPKASCTW